MEIAAEQGKNVTYNPEKEFDLNYTVNNNPETNETNNFNFSKLVSQNPKVYEFEKKKSVEKRQYNKEHFNYPGTYNLNESFEVFYRKYYVINPPNFIKYLCRFGSSAEHMDCGGIYNKFFDPSLGLKPFYTSLMFYNPLNEDLNRKKIYINYLLWFNSHCYTLDYDLNPDDYDSAAKYKTAMKAEEYKVVKEWYNFVNKIEIPFYASFTQDIDQFNEFTFDIDNMITELNLFEFRNISKHIRKYSYCFFVLYKDNNSYKFNYFENKRSYIVKYLYHTIYDHIKLFPNIDEKDFDSNPISKKIQLNIKSPEQLFKILPFVFKNLNYDVHAIIYNEQQLFEMMFEAAFVNRNEFENFKLFTFLSDYIYIWIDKFLYRPYFEPKMDLIMDHQDEYARDYIQYASNMHRGLLSKSITVVDQEHENLLHLVNKYFYVLISYYLGEFMFKRKNSHVIVAYKLDPYYLLMMSWDLNNDLMYNYGTSSEYWLRISDFLFPYIDYWVSEYTTNFKLILISNYCQMFSQSSYFNYKHLKNMMIIIKYKITQKYNNSKKNLLFIEEMRYNVAIWFFGINTAIVVHSYYERGYIRMYNLQESNISNDAMQNLVLINNLNKQHEVNVVYDAYLMLLQFQLSANQYNYWAYNSNLINTQIVDLCTTVWRDDRYKYQNTPYFWLNPAMPEMSYYTYEYCISNIYIDSLIERYKADQLKLINPTTKENIDINKQTQTQTQDLQPDFKSNILYILKTQYPRIWWKNLNYKTMDFLTSIYLSKDYKSFKSFNPRYFNYFCNIFEVRKLENKYKDYVHLSCDSMFEVIYRIFNNDLTVVEMFKNIKETPKEFYDKTIRKLFNLIIEFELEQILKFYEQYIPEYEMLKKEFLLDMQLLSDFVSKRVADLEYEKSFFLAVENGTVLEQPEFSHVDPETFVFKMMKDNQADSLIAKLKSFQKEINIIVAEINKFNYALNENLDKFLGPKFKDMYSDFKSYVHSEYKKEYSNFFKNKIKKYRFEDPNENSPQTFSSIYITETIAYRMSIEVLPITTNQIMWAAYDTDFVSITDLDKNNQSLEDDDYSIQNENILKKYYIKRLNQTKE